MTSLRFLFFFVVLLSVTMTTAGCGFRGATANEGRSLVERSELVVGVSASQPGIGLRTGDRYEGLDIDIALYLARQLGFERSQVRFVSAPPDRRVGKLLRDEVDMVVAAYPITPEQKTRIQFAGPYFVARQDIVVREGTSDIRTVQNLEGRPMCALRGTDVFENIRALEVLPLRRTAASWTRCLEQLKAGEVDAVAASDAMIAGYLRGEGGEDLRLLGEPFAEERWGVGLRKQDVQACEQLNRAISRMYVDGAATRIQRAWFAGTGFAPNRQIPQFEGCV